MAGAVRRVAMLADRITNPEQAGTVRAVVEGLARRGYGSVLVCESAGLDLRGSLDVVECPGLGDGWRLPWMLRGRRPDAATTRPDLLHVLQARMAWAGLELAERWGVPYLQSVEEFLPDGAPLRLSRRWSRWLIATSRELAVDLMVNFGVPADRVRVVHRGLAPVEPARRPEAGGPLPVIGSAGPLSASSGFATFLNAARRVIDAGVDAEFILVGLGEEEGDLRRRADRLRIADRVTFAADSAVGLSFWDVLDVYCQPSTVPTVGRNLARAMAHGLPAVASDIEGLRSLVRPGVTGLRVPPGDTDALARAMLDLLGDRPRARALGLAGRAEVVRDHDLGREAELLADLYDDVIEGEAANDTAEAGPPACRAGRGDWGDAPAAPSRSRFS